MIEFSGYITGTAEKFFIRKNCLFFGVLFAFALITSLPISLSLERMVSFEGFTLVVYSVMVLVVVIYLVVIFSNKFIDRIKPKRIYVSGETITCELHKQVDSKYVDDVKIVYEYNDFYYLVFPMGKKSVNFICQKNLLTQGSLEEFEDLFKDKIVNKSGVGSVIEP